MHAPNKVTNYLGQRRYLDADQRPDREAPQKLPALVRVFFTDPHLRYITT